MGARPRAYEPADAELPGIDEPDPARGHVGDEERAPVR